MKAVNQKSECQSATETIEISPLPLANTHPPSIIMNSSRNSSRSINKRVAWTADTAELQTDRSVLFSESVDALASRPPTPRGARTPASTSAKTVAFGKDFRNQPALIQPSDLPIHVFLTRLDFRLYWRTLLYLHDLYFSIPGINKLRRLKASIPSERRMHLLPMLWKTKVFTAPYFEGGHCNIMQQLGCWLSKKPLKNECIDILTGSLSIEDMPRACRLRRLLIDKRYRPRYDMAYHMSLRIGVTLETLMQNQPFLECVAQKGLRTPPKDWPGFEACWEAMKNAKDRVGEMNEKAKAFGKEEESRTDHARVAYEELTRQLMEDAGVSEELY